VKVVHIATGACSVPPAGAGGVENVIYFLTRRLSELGCDVGVIDVKAEVHEGLQSGVTFYECWDPPLAEKVWLRHAIRVWVFAILAIFKLWHLVRNKNVDIIHTHNQFSAPHVHTIHNQDLVICPTLVNRLKHVLEVIVLKKATHIVALTDTVRRQLVSGFNVDAAKVTLLPSGVEVEDIARFVASNPCQTSHDKVVLCPARICPRKNQLALLKAVPEVLDGYPETRFVFVGPIEDGSYANTLKRFVLDKGLSHAVAFTGEVSREYLYHLYQSATIFVLPTLYETQGLVVIEAMAFGLPVVASRIGPIEDIVRLGEGGAILIDPCSQKEIVSAIIRLLEDEGLRQELSARGKRLVSGRLAWGQIARETLNLYAKL